MFKIRIDKTHAVGMVINISILCKYVVYTIHYILLSLFYQKTRDSLAYIIII